MVQFLNQCIRESNLKLIKYFVIKNSIVDNFNKIIPKQIRSCCLVAYGVLNYANMSYDPTVNYRKCKNANQILSPDAFRSLRAHQLSRHFNSSSGYKEWFNSC